MREIKIDSSIFFLLFLTPPTRCLFEAQQHKKLMPEFIFTFILDCRGEVGESKIVLALFCHQ